MWRINFSNFRNIKKHSYNELRCSYSKTIVKNFPWNGFTWSVAFPTFSSIAGVYLLQCLVDGNSRKKQYSDRWILGLTHKWWHGFRDQLSGTRYWNFGRFLWKKTWHRRLKSKFLTWHHLWMTPYIKGPRSFAK
jgi:hypothetical protein